MVSSDYATPMGVVRCWAETFAANRWLQLRDYLTAPTLSDGHTIELYELEIPDDSTNFVHAWVWTITKTHSDAKRLRVNCEIAATIPVVDFVYQGGQHLSCIGCFSKDYQIHIGTEDREMLYRRAALSQRMPNRFTVGAKNPSSCTSCFGLDWLIVTENRLAIEIPDLLNGEQISVHFVASGQHYRPYEKDDSVRDESSWLAVDISNNTLHSRIAELSTRSQRATEQNW